MKLRQRFIYLERWRIARHSCRARIETGVLRLVGTGTAVSPGTRAGRGLKLAIASPISFTLTVSPGTRAGRGLKHALPVLKLFDDTVSPGTRAGRGLKLNGLCTVAPSIRYRPALVPGAD